MRILGSPMRIYGSHMKKLGSHIKILRAHMKILGSPMKILGSPMRILGSPMKRQVGSPIKRGLRWVSDDDDFFPDSKLCQLFYILVIII